MRVSELAIRYAKATFDLAVEKKNQEKVVSDLRALTELFEKDKDIHGYLVSPLVKPEEKEAVLEKAVANAGLSNEAHQLLILLARKERLAVFPQVVQGFQDLLDKANGVSRGVVRSATALGPADRQQIESIVEKAISKKVIMTYKVDPSVIGGLVAQVGSYTFDDSIDAHLRRLNEELKRRTV
jgi:F-type H+-transporting ATPase subunit delta